MKEENPMSFLKFLWNSCTNVKRYLVTNTDSNLCFLYATLSSIAEQMVVNLIEMYFSHGYSLKILREKLLSKLSKYLNGSDIEAKHIDKEERRCAAVGEKVCRGLIAFEIGFGIDIKRSKGFLLKGLVEVGLGMTFGCFVFW